MASADERASAIYDQALVDEATAAGSRVPGYARRAALRAMHAFAAQPATVVEREVSDARLADALDAMAMRTPQLEWQTCLREVAVAIRRAVGIAGAQASGGISGKKAGVIAVDDPLAFNVCPRAACGSEDIEVGPGSTARCNTCGVRW
jgi:hypothetical protein